MKFVMSPLPKTWVFDLDGTIVIHNGYKINGQDELLPGVKQFFATLSPDDYVIFLTARTEEYREKTIAFLKDNGIRFNEILFNIPVGERIIVNDNKPSGLTMAYAVCKERDQELKINYSIDENI